MGKKQMALLLLVLKLGQSGIGEIHKTIGTGTYKSCQSALNKLVDKGMLLTVKRRHKLLYSLTESGAREATTVRATLCDDCYSLSLIRSLYA